MTSLEDAERAVLNTISAMLPETHEAVVVFWPKGGDGRFAINSTSPPEETLRALDSAREHIGGGADPEVVVNKGHDA